MDLKICDRCGKVIPDFSSMNRILYRTKKLPSVLRFEATRGEWNDRYVELCDDCRRELDGWLKKGKMQGVSHGKV